MPKAFSFAPSLLVLLLGCTALTGPAQAGWFDFGSSKPEAKPAQTAPKDKPGDIPAASLDDSIRQAQVLRLAGSYPEAIRHLSQLMMVASDDPRVVGEYGKTLAAMGRASDAINFLTRAQQLQPNDWTIYSAMGVAHDQLSNPKDAQTAYERALILKPGEPSVLSNYALSRLLAKDPDMARNLAGRAEIANAATRDEKIARNISVVRNMLADKPADAAFAVSKPAPAQLAAAPVPAPRQTPSFVSLPPPQQALPQPAPRQPVHRQVANNPSALPPQNQIIQALPQFVQPMTPAPQGVVMQRVPVDPLAGPVNSATRAPRALLPKKAETVARTESVKPEPAHVLPVKAAALPAKPASEAESLQARAEAIAKNLANKPAAIAAAKTEASKPAPARATPVKAAESKPILPGPAPKVLPPKTAPEVRTAAAPKPAKAKDLVPALRVSSTAY